MYKEAEELLCSNLEEERCLGIEKIVAYSIELLVSKLEQEQSIFVRHRLIDTLGTFRSAQIATSVARLLESPEAYVRNSALTIMQMLGEVALPVLADLMDHPDCNLRKLATDALSKIPGDIACSLLISGLDDSDANIISTCAENLGNRQDVRIVPALTLALAVTEDVWVAFAIMEALAKTGDNTILAVIEEYVNNKKWNQHQHVTLAGIWSIAVGKLGDESQLTTAWKMFDNKVLTIEQMLTMIDSLQKRGINLVLQQSLILSMLETFFAQKLKNSNSNELVLAVHIASSSCPALIYDYLPVIIEVFGTVEAVMDEIITAVKLGSQVVEPRLRGTGMYKLLAYMYEHDPYFEHRCFILNCPDIFHADYYADTWEWLVDNLAEDDLELKKAAIRGLCRISENGRRYLQKMLVSPLISDPEITEFIEQELTAEWGIKR